jgi:hypothetical protein
LKKSTILVNEKLIPPKIPPNTHPMNGNTTFHIKRAAAMDVVQVLPRGGRKLLNG